MVQIYILWHKYQMQNMDKTDLISRINTQNKTVPGSVMLAVILDV